MRCSRVEGVIMKMKKINLNDYVYVKLNPKGIDIYYHRYDDVPGLGEKFRCMPQIDENGFTKMQLHDFMNLYGHYMYTGAPDVLDEINLYFENEDVYDF